jgi:RNA polymerase sigma factor (sigma-70 family)
MHASGASALVAAAAGGDEAAWNELVERFAGLVWAVARAHRLSTADAADVSQTTWLRLAEHLGRLRDPERVGAWLATTARHESLRVLRHAARFEAISDDHDWLDDRQQPPESGLVRRERRAALMTAFGLLPDNCRSLLRVLFADPEPSYEEVAAATGLPVGSIGPTRARCLERLRRTPAIARINAETDNSGG